MKSLPSLKSLLLITLPLLFGSCQHEYPAFIYETTGMSLSNADNTGETPISDNDSIPRVAYALQLNLAMLTKEDGDKYEGYYQQEDVVNAFSITSPDVFNGVPANESLNQFFSYYTGHGVGNHIGTTGPFTALFSGSNSSNSPDTWYTTKHLLLMDPPASAGDYTFIVYAGFDDGRELIDTVTVKLY